MHIDIEFPNAIQKEKDVLKAAKAMGMKCKKIGSRLRIESSKPMDFYWLGVTSVVNTVERAQSKATAHTKLIIQD